MLPFEGKRILITGGTGSLGKTLIRRVFTGEMGDPARVIVFSRDEAKQHFLRVEFDSPNGANSKVLFKLIQERLEYRIGDVRDLSSVHEALRDADIVFNAAALKQVPACEYHPYEAVATNITGAENIVRAIALHGLPIETVIGVSTDKACKPVNVMGMTKAIQERIFVQANTRAPGTRFVCVRYGNVLASRGSVIPLFHEQIRTGGPVTITTPDMTRFLLGLDEAVDTIFAAVKDGAPGETYVPKAPSSLILNVATALIGNRRIEVETRGIRPGEKTHEILISDEEALRTVQKGNWYAIRPMLPELCADAYSNGRLMKEYSSGDDVMSFDQTVEMLATRRLRIEDQENIHDEILR